MTPSLGTRSREVGLRAAETALRGVLALPAAATGLVLFAHGSGSSRHSPRNQHVAGMLAEGGLGTLLVDLLSEDEERLDRITGELRFDVDFLARRLLAATDWIAADPDAADVPLGYFGASTGAAAAIVAAAERPDVRAVVSRGGRPDLAADALPRLRAPTLLIVGGADEAVLALNRRAHDAIAAEKQLEVVPGAGHLFEEPGALDEVGRLARDWFTRHLQ